MRDKTIFFPEDFVGKKMVCINDAGWETTKGIVFKSIVDSTGPSENDIVTVIGGYRDRSGVYFLLDGWSKFDKDGYSVGQFVYAENLEQKFIQKTTKHE